MNDTHSTEPVWGQAVEEMADRGFVFIHINKTGGSSIRTALGISGYQHVRAAEVAAWLGERRWSRLETFSTIRNPWDRLVSMYHWRVSTNQTGLADSPIPFADWLDLCLRKRDPFYVKNPLMLAPQTYWLCDDTGRLLVDRLLRFERLAADFAEFCSVIRFDGLELPHLKKTERRHYSVYFSECDAELVGQVYKSDIDAFGYTFEAEPT